VTTSSLTGCRRFPLGLPPKSLTNCFFVSDCDFAHLPLFVPFRLCGGTSILVPNEEVRDGRFRSQAGFKERNRRRLAGAELTICWPSKQEEAIPSIRDCLFAFLRQSTIVNRKSTISEVHLHPQPHRHRRLKDSSEGIAVRQIIQRDPCLRMNGPSKRSFQSVQILES
jgi:hypothetical protein